MSNKPCQCVSQHLLSSATQVFLEDHLEEFFPSPSQETRELSSPLRVSTASAAQASNDLNTSATQYVSTGLRSLDYLLRNRDPMTVSGSDTSHGGVPRGKVSEVWGPSGVGKTSLGMQLAASILDAGEGVIWLDASHSLPGPRLSRILASLQSKILQEDILPRTLSGLLENLTHFLTPTLAHFIALIYGLPTTSNESYCYRLIIDFEYCCISSKCSWAFTTQTFYPPVPYRLLTEARRNTQYRNSRSISVSNKDMS